MQATKWRRALNKGNGQAGELKILEQEEVKEEKEDGSLHHSNVGLKHSQTLKSLKPLRLQSKHHFYGYYWRGKIATKEAEGERRWLKTRG